MVAPHCHTTAEAKAAIKRIEHNSQGTSGPPTGISGGSAGNQTTKTEDVTSTEKGGDYVSKRGI